MKLHDLWQAVLTELQLTLPKAKFTVFFSQTFLVSRQKLKSGAFRVELAVPHSYAKDTIQNYYLKRVAASLDRITGTNNEVSLIIKSPPPNGSGAAGPLFQISQEQKADSQNQVLEALNRVRIRPEYNFEAFAVSPTNEVAYAAATAVAKNPGKAYSPLFLYGGVGVGKTHLMQAIAHEIISKDPQVVLIYCMGEEFTNEIIEAIRNKRTQGFKQRYRTAQVLLIDDIQFIAGKNTVQEEFFHTFNAIQRGGGQVVLASDRPPHEIQLLEDRLRSRFEGGLTIDIQEPNFELRTAILLIKAQQLSVSLPMDVAQLLAADITSTRKLEGVLSRLATESQLRNQAISLEMAQGILGSPPQQPEAKPVVRPKEIVDAVAQHFELKQGEMKSPVRSRPILVPRQLAMYLLRQELHLPLVEIGQMFGGKDHTTVMHAVKKMGQELSRSEDLRLELSLIRKKLYG
jgi:chromosomal replication initiator protein